MSDFYGDILGLVQPELDVRLAIEDVARRRGLPVGEVLIEALQDFLAKDFLDPKSDATDMALCFPAGEDKALMECTMPWPVQLCLPTPDMCPDENLDEWIALVEIDMSKMHTAMTKFDSTTDPKARSQFSRVMKQYGLVRDRLFVRKGARDAHRRTSPR